MGSTATRSAGLWFVGAALMASGCAPVLGIEDTVLDEQACTLMTQRVFFSDKLVKNTDVVVGAVSQRRFAQLAGELGVTIDPTKGHALARVTDCQNEVAEFADVTFDGAASGTTPFFVAGKSFAEGTATGVDGLAGALNLSAPLEVVSTAFPDGITVESSQGDVVTRPGELSFIVLDPNSEVVVTPPMVSEWDCVGTIAEPVVSAAQITITVNVQNASAFAPNGIGIAAARVTVCVDETAACEVDPKAPIDPSREALTDANGQVQLLVDTGTEGFDGQLIITGTDSSCQ